MHAQHMDIILIFARTRDVGLCRPCLHEKKTDMEQFGKILIVDDNEDVLFALNLLLEPYAEKIKVAVTPDRIEHFMTTFRPDIILLDMNFSLTWKELEVEIKRRTVHGRTSERNAGTGNTLRKKIIKIIQERQATGVLFSSVNDTDDNKIILC